MMGSAEGPLLLPSSHFTPLEILHYPDPARSILPYSPTGLALGCMF